jgi:hypothetical protein
VINLPSLTAEGYRFILKKPAEPLCAVVALNSPEPTEMMLALLSSA